MIKFLLRLGLTAVLTTAILPAAFADELNLTTYAGKVVYVDFWASWCAPCRQSFPWMNNLHKQKARDGLVIIAVNVDQDLKLADQFIKQFNPAFSILFDSNGKLASSFNVAGMPSAYIIGRDGKIRFTHIGFHENKTEQYEQEIQSLLDEKI